MIEFIQYIVLGIIQGISEIFPISSSGHLVIFTQLFGLDTNHLTIFLMITNMGSFLALLFFFRKDVVHLVVTLWHFLFNKEKRQEPTIKEEASYVLKLIIGVIPIGILGLLLKNHLKFLETPLYAGIALLVTSILLLLIFLFRNRLFDQDITWKNALIIGLFQGIAVVPGISRSGITTIGGLSRRVELKKALKYSFLMYLIVSVPVSLLGLLDLSEASDTINWVGYIGAFFMSMIFSYLTAKLMYKVVKVNNFIYFSVYTALMGIFAIVLNFI